MAGKSVLVIDTPKNCPECQLMADGWCYGIPSREEVQGKIKYLKRPSWCPLIPLPQKRINKDCLVIHEIWNEGWNACFDEIMGENE